MSNEVEYEKSYVLSVLRHPDEPGEAPLDRLASSIPIEPEDLSSNKLAQILRLVLANAMKERATSIVLAAQAIGTDVATMMAQACEVDRAAVGYYAEQVREKSDKRYINTEMEKIRQDVRGMEPGDALDHSLSALSRISKTSDSDAVTPVDIATEHFVAWYKEYQAAMKRGDLRFSFPFKFLNDKVPYVFPGHSILITAYSKVGKSTLAQQIFDGNCNRGLHGVYFHFEDSKEVMGIRRTARYMAHEENGISAERMLKYILSSDEMALVDKVNQGIQKWMVRGTQVHCPGWTMERVIRVWRRLWLAGKADFAVIDYLNKATPTPYMLRHYGRWGSLGLAAEMLKQVAEQTGSTLILVQQEKGDGDPYGSMEAMQKFQVWIRLSRDEDDETRGTVQIKAANMGSTGESDVRFNPKWLMWGM